MSLRFYICISLSERSVDTHGHMSQALADCPPDANESLRSQPRTPNTVDWPPEPLLPPRSNNYESLHAHSPPSFPGISNPHNYLDSLVSSTKLSPNFRPSRAVRSASLASHIHQIRVFYSILTIISCSTVGFYCQMGNDDI